MVGWAGLCDGLGLAWFLRWETTDLVWSLWLFSLVVGYATIVWTITRGLREFSANAATDATHALAKGKIVTGSTLLVGALFLLAFFTVHFGGFHLGHSVFLGGFFPIAGTSNAWPGVETYAEVVKRYWVFLPAAFIAERVGFRETRPVKDDGALTTEAIAMRKARQPFGDGSGLMALYKNVIRMHRLIFSLSAPISHAWTTSSSTRWSMRCIFSHGGCSSGCQCRATPP